MSKVFTIKRINRVGLEFVRTISPISLVRFVLKPSVMIQVSANLK